MKSLELKKIIREEVKKSLQEQTQIRPEISADELKSLMIPILEKLEKKIEDASKKITITLTKNQRKNLDPSKDIIFKNMMVTRKGVKETNKLIDDYNWIADRANAYIDSLRNPKTRDKGYNIRSASIFLDQIREVLKKYNL